MNFNLARERKLIVRIVKLASITLAVQHAISSQSIATCCDGGLVYLRSKRNGQIFLVNVAMKQRSHFVVGMSGSFGALS